MAMLWPMQSKRSLLRCLCCICLLLQLSWCGAPAAQDKSKLEAQLRQVTAQKQVLERGQDKRDNAEIRKREAAMSVSAWCLRSASARQP